MDDFESLGHSKWDCKYHVVFIPKGRRSRNKLPGESAQKGVANISLRLNDIHDVSTYKHTED